MKIDRTVTIELTVKEVNEIIKKSLEKEGFQVQNIESKVSADSYDERYGGPPSYSFSGLRVKATETREKKD